MQARTTGSVTRPWKRPNRQIKRKILKKDMKIWEREVTEKNVFFTLSKCVAN